MVSTVLLFALLQPIQLLILWMYARKKNIIHLLTANYAVLYLDWLFVPFNALIAFSINFSWTFFFFILAVSLIITIFMHCGWQRLSHKPKETAYFINDHGLTSEGKVHFIFMAIQMALIATVFFSKATSFYYTILLIFLLLYLVSFLLIILFVRKVKLRSKVETPLIIGAIIITLLRFFL